MEKSIDLGKLQNDLRQARANHLRAVTVANNAQHKLGQAQMAADKADKALEAAGAALDKVKKSVLEAARTVASS